MHDYGEYTMSTPSCFIIVSYHLLLILPAAGKKVWKPVALLRGAHDGLINAVALSPDGQYFVSVGQDDTVNTWNCAEFLDGSNTTPQRRVYFANNNEGRKWLCSIRPVFDAKHPHAFVAGSMETERSLNVFVMNESGGRAGAAGAAVPVSSGGEGDVAAHVKSVIRYNDQVSGDASCICICFDLPFVEVCCLPACLSDIAVCRG